MGNKSSKSKKGKVRSAAATTEKVALKKEESLGSHLSQESVNSVISQDAERGEGDFVEFLESAAPEDGPWPSPDPRTPALDSVRQSQGPTPDTAASSLPRESAAKPLVPRESAENHKYGLVSPKHFKVHDKVSVLISSAWCPATITRAETKNGMHWYYSIKLDQRKLPMRLQQYPITFNNIPPEQVRPRCAAVDLLAPALTSAKYGKTATAFMEPGDAAKNKEWLEQAQGMLRKKSGEPAMTSDPNEVLFLKAALEKAEDKLEPKNRPYPVKVYFKAAEPVRRRLAGEETTIMPSAGLVSALTLTVGFLAYKVYRRFAAPRKPQEPSMQMEEP